MFLSFLVTVEQLALALSYWSVSSATRRSVTHCSNLRNPMDTYRGTTSPQKLPLRNRFYDTRLLPRYRPGDTIRRLSGGYVDDVTLIHIVPRDRLILLELNHSLLIFLLIVLNPERQRRGPVMSARGCNHLRRGNLNVDASPRQLHQACCEFGLKHSAEGGISFFRDVAMQNLKSVVIRVRSHTIWAKDSTIQSSLRLDIDTALMVTSGIFRSRDVKDRPSLAVVIRMYTAVPVCKDVRFPGEEDRNVIPKAGIEDSVYSIDQALKPKVGYAH